ncbi:guanosine pentaphosphatase [Psychromonas sp. 14N.309.X.WAT.B.A12]|uniref:Ppx/GppA phosphatase family protein n=1 Tax=Psychromonas sp. 14N.309.X.WAT.B.A12 TaxID=2998322 RepID=UPI0025B28076|nr:guanosine pentaphosphatase [Psychromonas sp. 14N.309.X.WAT.B.A12]MDN2664607.1 guanosine pentaphosphatase [Psychromonas sp. 14N.309.X.WAT.B.A12]
MTAARYTIIDLGSNSFHMLTVSKQGNGFNVVSKHKQKVRLAAGLNGDKQLDQTTMQRGWACLENFRLLLDQIKPVTVLITATAALRIAVNSEEFIKVAEKILGHPINLISGVQEAKTIFKGVSYTEQTDKKLLVIDIGGASTELVLGQGNHVHIANSLNIGCVTWLSHYFADQQLNKYNFNNAINAARQVISTVKTQYSAFDWELTLGASGTIQAVNEVNQAQQLSDSLSFELLQQIKQQCIACKTIEQLDIVGLEASRAPVFTSGLAILIALFESLNIQQMQLSNGALREGLISMMFNNQSEFN